MIEDHDAEREWRRASRLHILDGLLGVAEDPHRFLDIMLSVQDAEEAQEALHQQLGLSPDQSRAAINLQFRNMTQGSRRLLQDEAAQYRN